MGYIPAEQERALLKHGVAGGDAVQSAFPDQGLLRQLRAEVKAIHSSDALIEYLQRLMAQSRQFPGIRVGLSPRAGMSLLSAGKAHAYIEGRDYVSANDIQAVFIEAAAHRIHPAVDGKNRELAEALLKSVAVD